MRAWIALGLLLTSLSASAAERRVFVMDFESAEASPDELDAMEQRVSEVLARRGDLEVITGDEVRELLALESERQRVGCEDDVSCLSEVVGAYGAQWMLTGRVSRVGALLVAQLALVDTRAASTVARASAEAEELDALFGRLSSAAEALLRELPTPERRAPAAWVWTGHSGVLVAVIGAAGAAVGAIPALRFYDEESRLAASAAEFERAPTPAAVDAVVARRAALETASADWNGYGVALVIAGGGLVAAGLVVAAVGYGVGAARAEAVE